jgi:hypothetical protein
VVSKQVIHLLVVGRVFHPKCNPRRPGIVIEAPHHSCGYPGGDGDGRCVRTGPRGRKRPGGRVRRRGVGAGRRARGCGCPRARARRRARYGRRQARTRRLGIGPAGCSRLGGRGCARACRC